MLRKLTREIAIRQLRVLYRDCSRHSRRLLYWPDFRAELERLDGQLYSSKMLRAELRASLRKSRDLRKLNPRGERMVEKYLDWVNRARGAPRLRIIRPDDLDESALRDIARGTNT